VEASKVKKLLVMLFMVFILFALVACQDASPTESVDDPPASDLTPGSESEIGEPDPVEQQTPEPTVPNGGEDQSQLPEQPDDDDDDDDDEVVCCAFCEIDYFELFSPIIESFAMLERTGFTHFEYIPNTDRFQFEHEFDETQWIEQSITEIQAWVLNNFDSDDLPSFSYALYPLSGEKVMELIISLANDDHKIVGVYRLLGTHRIFAHTNLNERVFNITLTIPSDESFFGDIVIITSTSRLSNGELQEYFKLTGPAVGVGWLEMIRTNNMRQRFRVSYCCNDIEGREGCVCADFDFTLSEEEYLEIIRRFGTAGYNVAEIVEARHIHLEWKPVLND
jgi:hypothetical protein